MKKSIQLSLPSEEFTESTAETADWRQIIFLPFQPLWQLVLVISIIADVFCAIFDVFYNPTERDFLNALYYICEILYSIDTVLVILHR